MALFEVLGKIFNWVPKREEHRRKEIDKTKRQMHKITNSDGNYNRDYDKYKRLADKLRVLEEAAINS